MQFTVVGGLECNRADGALVQDLTVFFFDVSLLSLKGPENHITVKTSGRKGKHNCCNSALYTVGKGGGLKKTLHFLPSYSLVPSLASIVQAVFPDVLLDVCRTTQGTTLRAAVRGLMCMNA